MQTPNPDSPTQHAVQLDLVLAQVERDLRLGGQHVSCHIQHRHDAIGTEAIALKKIGQHDVRGADGAPWRQRRRRRRLLLLAVEVGQPDGGDGRVQVAALVADDQQQRLLDLGGCVEVLGACLKSPDYDDAYL